MTDPRGGTSDPDREDHGVDLFVPSSHVGGPSSASGMSADAVATQTLPAVDMAYGSDKPRDLHNRPSGVDRAFRLGTMSVGAFVLVITGSIGVFLAYQGIPTFRRYGLSFVTNSAFDPYTSAPVTWPLTRNTHPMTFFLPSPLARNAASNSAIFS